MFASATRAPESVKSAILAIDGVSAVTTRIVNPVIIDIDGMTEPATGMLISIPEHGEPAVNRLYVSSGRLPEPGRSDEVAIIEAFAEAHGFQSGRPVRRADQRPQANAFHHRDHAVARACLCHRARAIWCPINALWASCICGRGALKAPTTWKALSMMCRSHCRAMPTSKDVMARSTHILETPWRHRGL
jgi:hypothetical protein